MTASLDPTPQQRLADSRLAIVNYMRRDSGDDDGDGGDADSGDGNGGDGASAAAAGSAHGLAGGGTSRSGSGSGSGSRAAGYAVWKTLKRATLTWWRHHPAHMALDVAVGVSKPVLYKYAEEKPLQLLAAAAAVGAAAVLVRPWRLMSITGLLLATLKSSGLSSTLLSLITPQRESSKPSKDVKKTG